jgi:hypothetical protein
MLRWRLWNSKKAQIHIRTCRGNEGAVEGFVWATEARVLPESGILLKREELRGEAFCDASAKPQGSNSGA